MPQSRDFPFPSGSGEIYGDLECLWHDSSAVFCLWHDSSAVFYKAMVSCDVQGIQWASHMATVEKKAMHTEF
jgi:hypothetical protein